MAQYKTCDKFNISDEEEYIEPIQRFSSSDVVQALCELRFTPTAKQENENENNNLLSTDWHTMHIHDIIKQFDSNIDNGLNQTKIRNLQEKYGKNQLTAPPEKHWLLKYLFNYTLWFIIISMILSLITGILFNHILILIFGILLLLLIILSFCTTFSNQKKHQLQHSLASLKKDVLVLRDNNKQTIESIHLVPGDIIFIRMGCSIEADIRIIECTENFEIDESPLNGNIEPQCKNYKIANDIDALESHNMLFNGCICINGECKGIVVAIGDNTFVGKMNKLANEQQTNNRLNDDSQYVILSYKSKFIISVCICLLSVICFVLILIVDIKNMISMIEILWFIIGIILLLIPLLIVCVISKLRANIVVRLLRQNMFVKTRDCIYKLGDINVICVDKNLLMTNGKINDLNECIKQYDNMNIKIVIISQDNTQHIESICKQCGYWNGEHNGIIVCGDQINEYSLNWSDVFKRKRIIFSSILPQQKVIIINKMKEINIPTPFICMTGDGTPNCVAMKQSDFSISLGIMGTDVAKEASDIVVMDDKLESIIKGIEIAKQMKQSFSYKLQQKL
eukprot:484286_1